MRIASPAETATRIARERRPMKTVPHSRSGGRRAHDVSFRLRDVRGRPASSLSRTDVSCRSLVALAVDGVALGDARRCWRGARIAAVTAEFPTTSSTGWLSSVTGLAPVEHGALGVMQRMASGGILQSVFSRVPIGAFPVSSTIFHDAARLGYRPLALTGDLVDCEGPWRAALLAGAEISEGPRLLAGGARDRAEPERIVEALEDAIEAAMAREPRPVFLWCHLDVDLAIHFFGVDAWVVDLLHRLDAMAMRLSRRARIVAYSDHGLVPTRHDASLAERLSAFCAAEGLDMGGAGRVRWLYDADDPRLASALRALLPDDVRVARREDVFPDGLYTARIGPLVLEATGERFLTDPLYTHDHGSSLPTETGIPYAAWEAP